MDPKNIQIWQILRRWCKNMNVQWYFALEGSCPAVQRVQVLISHSSQSTSNQRNGNFLFKLASNSPLVSSSASFDKRGSTSLTFQAFSLCFPASSLTRKSTWGQLRWGFRLRRWAVGNILRQTSDDQCLGSYKGLGHCVCWCCGLLQVPTNLSSVLKELCSSNTEAHQNIYPLCSSPEFQTRQWVWQT